MLSIRFRTYWSTIALLACNPTSPSRPLSSAVVSGFIHSTSSSLSKQRSNQFLPSSSSSSSSFLTMSTESSSTSEVNVCKHLQEVRDKLTEACEESGRIPSEVSLVAVSKTKPLDLIIDAYKNGGQRIFGENYAQELVDKAGKIVEVEPSYENDISWHFIGGLQSNKANMLVKGVVPYGKLVVETVNSQKVANKLNNAMSDFINQDNVKPLDIFVQINTSGEESKSGIMHTDVEEIIGLCQHITSDCPNLHLKGLMTIGAVGDVQCFDLLKECQTKVMEELNLSDGQLGLSMGMSGDYEAAIQKGSTNVRVGSTIFGARDYSK